MTAAELGDNIRKKSTMLCVGLDTDYSRLPECLRHGDPVEAMLEFNKTIIDATAPYCVAFKPNLAFYELWGAEGWTLLERTVQYIRAQYPDQFIIADAKRGDIGNTARMYADAFFGRMDFDAVTLSPYMGRDSVLPFLEYKGRFAIVVALSSNSSSADFQGGTREPMYIRVIRRMMEISTPDNMMFVTGATKAPMLTEIRKIAPDNFLLVPGVGAQGGSAEEVIRYGATARGGLLINSSRAVLYASCGPDFAGAAARVASQTARFGTTKST